MYGMRLFDVLIVENRLKTPKWCFDWCFHRPNLHHLQWWNCWSFLKKKHLHIFHKRSNHNWIIDVVEKERHLWRTAWVHLWSHVLFSGKPLFVIAAFLQGIFWALFYHLRVMLHRCMALWKKHVALKLESPSMPPHALYTHLCGELSSCCNC